MKEKRGVSRKVITWGIIIAVVISTLILFTVLHNYCEVSADLAKKASSEGVVHYFYSGVLWFKTSVLQCQRKDLGFISGTINSIKGLLGFNEGFFDFAGDLLIGVFVGLWLWIVFSLATVERWVYSIFFFEFVFGKDEQTYMNSLNDSWLSLLANSIWKIIPIAIVYAVIMQIPIINSFIKVVTLEPLLSFKGTMWGSILKSFIIAFYIGFLPTGIEQYSRYRIRKKYYAAIEWEKAAVALEQERIKGRK